MLALIDGDVCLYQVGFAVQKKHWMVGDLQADTKSEMKRLAEQLATPLEDVKEVIEVDPISHALHSVKSMAERIMNEAGCSDKRIFLTGSANFRVDLFPEYKANRKDTPKPVLYEEIRQYMIEHMGAEEIHGQEADDELGIQQCEDTVICTIDKDLLMIEGQHYNWRKPDQGVVTVTREEGLHWFYQQLLMGDSVDNIPGLKGIGPKKAEKILSHLIGATKAEYDEEILAQYKAHPHYKDLTDQSTIDTINLHANLLLIRTEEDQDLWKLTEDTGHLALPQTQTSTSVSSTL
jgi:5'-3' exonuclease